MNGQEGRDVPREKAPWKVMVVDDEEEVHAVTRLVLREVCFDGRPVQLLHARSAKEALLLFARHGDVAVAFVDVVMETEDAGLRLVRQVREALGNRFVRLILRTGQPGAAPEREVISRYEINDYKAKSELSSLRLFTTLMVALRGYRDIIALERARQGLAHLLEGASALFQASSVEAFARVALDKLLLLDGGPEAQGLYWICCASAGRDGQVLAATGRYVACVGSRMPACAPELASRAASELPYRFDGASLSLRLSSRYGETHLLYVSRAAAPTPLQHSLLELFQLKATAALDRLLLQDKSDAAQRFAVRALARFSKALSAQPEQPELLEKARPGSPGKRREVAGAAQSGYPDFLYQLAVQAEAPEWGEAGAARHVRRIGRYAAHLARLCGRDEAYCATIARAAPLHDVGKLYIPACSAAAWYEPDPARREQAMAHTLAGEDLLPDGQGAIMDMAAAIVRHHHEAWNGSGYPAGLAGDHIPLAARIVALADFFDVTGHASAQPERPAYPDAEIFGMIQVAAGYYFDPRLVRLFIQHRAEFVAMKGE